MRDYFLHNRVLTFDCARHAAGDSPSPDGELHTMEDRARTSVRPSRRSIAYFSMEIALESAMPTYSGGLGVLAGDTIRAAADAGLPMVGVSLLYRQGYFSQEFAADGSQIEHPVHWYPENFLQEEEPRASLAIEGRRVELRAWRYEVKGARGSLLPVYFLDADLPANDGFDRSLTGSLYSGDVRYRLCQEVILGIGGVRMLRALGYTGITRYHMNEGHAGLLSLELLDEEAEKAGRRSVRGEDIEAVRRRCIFTTHTPVPAGHDQFPMDLVTRVLPNREDFLDMQDVFCVDLLKNVLQEQREFPDLQQAAQAGTRLNMTYLALNLSGYVNGVAKQHGETSRSLFSGYDIEAITNGVHAATWTAPAFRLLFDRYIPGWREDNFSLRAALGLPTEDVLRAHLAAKGELLEIIRQRTGRQFDLGVFTIGFARRATGYKRADLILSDIERLKRIAASSGPFQLVFAGKAHPHDGGGKEIIKRIFAAREALHPEVPVVYLDEYNLELGGKITAGVDLWLNTPQFPLEASGTSGMKAALNGVPSLSVLDGWWIEGHIEGVTGWSIGDRFRPVAPAADPKNEADALYHKLESVILPLFYSNHDAYLAVMLHAIALNGSFFNTQRMLQQYVTAAYYR